MKIIAIEGCDGAGKGLQFNLLTKKLASLGKNVAIASFPQYEGFFGVEIGKMLSGKHFARADNVDSKSMALWYAMDRFDTLSKVNTKNADYLLLNRYTLSNIVYQSLRYGSATSPKDKFYDWVFELEHNVLKLPKPDIYFILDIDHTMSKKNVQKKGFRKYVGDEADVYEKKENFMKNVRDTYLDLASKLDNAFVINCMETDGEMLPPNVIHNIILENL